MTFDTRQITIPDEPFEFIGLDGETYHLPNINTLTGAQAKRMRTGDESVIQEIADPGVFEAVDDLPVGVQSELSRAWVKHGESQGKGASRSRGTSTRQRPKR